MTKYNPLMPDASPIHHFRRKRPAVRKSKRTLCPAIDINDEDGALVAWCMAHPEVLGKPGLWLEHPSTTPRWLHVQIVQHNSRTPGKLCCGCPCVPERVARPHSRFISLAPAWPVPRCAHR